MSLHHMGLWHWEYIPARGVEDCYRVGDEDDDPVRSFATEEEAKTFVRVHNERYLAERDPKWEY